MPLFSGQRERDEGQRDRGTKLGGIAGAQLVPGENNHIRCISLTHTLYNIHPVPLSCYIWFSMCVLLRAGAMSHSTEERLGEEVGRHSFTDGLVDEWG